LNLLFARYLGLTDFGGRNPAITPLEWEAPVKRSTLAGASFLAGAALLGGFLDLGVGKGRMPTGA
jgi:hypothetical protein